MNKPTFKFKNGQLPSLAKFVILGLLWAGSPLNGQAESVGCNDTFVQLNNNEIVIEVAPSHSNDTVNIQCALDAAASMGVPIVRLEADTYFISHISVDEFSGAFQGRTQATTFVQVLDGSINCTAMNNAGHLAAAIKFVGGEPRIRFMTISADMPCSTGVADTILHFTGESAQTDNCDNDVIFAVVDRVTLDGTNTDTGARAAVMVDPEGRLLGGCKTKLLGTFKLNRSIIRNTFAGLVTSMKAGAQVDINFNEFRNNLQAVDLLDGYQNTTITANKFFGDNSMEQHYFAVHVGNAQANPPATTRMIVNNNEFNVMSTFAERTSYAVSGWFESTEYITNISSVISNNTFNLSGENTYGVMFGDISNGHVSANRFNGSGARAIYFYANTAASGWTITANKGLADFESYRGHDIRFQPSISNCIVGAGQGATVRDNGTNNTILPQ